MACNNSLTFEFSSHSCEILSIHILKIVDKLHMSPVFFENNMLLYEMKRLRTKLQNNIAILGKYLVKGM